jgi:hypothetical protein
MFPAVLRPLTWVTAGLAAAATAVVFGADRPPVTPAVPVGPPPRVVEAAESDNPRVDPGLVRWHATFADAQAAARKSGRPVLLFHMMGRLDRQFC